MYTILNIFIEKPTSASWIHCIKYKTIILNNLCLEPYFKTSTPLRALNTTVDPSFCVTPMNLSSNSWLSTSVYSTDHNESK